MAKGTTIVIVEQFAAAVLDVADMAVVLVNGRIALSGKPSEVAKDLADAYLGGQPARAFAAGENPLVAFGSAEAPALV